MSNNHGLGCDTFRPASLITPCPAVIDHYFRKQLHYNRLIKKTNDDEPFVAVYSRGLNYPDRPIFEDLAGQHYLSYIVVDLYSGAILDTYFELRNKHKIVRTYQELAEEIGENKSIEWIFKWHLNIVHMTKEYLKGGWLYRPKRQENLSATKDKYVILNKKGFTNILNNARPDNVEFLGNGKIK